ncbi:MAG: beta family protein [Candidatus Hydrogenedentes bacterium]|nr:beta family protein [Candidatus Hydrogenedentota bacterium]
MRFDHRHYVPCLRWKLGEYQAIRGLSGSTKDFITPLIEVPEIGFDFEHGEQSRSVDAHLELFVKRVRPKWDGRHCFVDLRLIDPTERMTDRGHPVAFVFDGLASQNCAATPVTGLDRDQHYQRAVRSAASKDGRGMCLRLSIEDAARPDIKISVDVLLRNSDLDREECDLVIDLGAPNFEPVAGFAKLITELVARFPYLSQWRTLTLMGTSFPPSMAEIEIGSTIVRRWEWILYKRVVELLVNLRHRLPTFGDYAINYPDILPMDMRLLKPSATIRYTIDDAWLFVKGRNVREHKFEQYRNHCQVVLESGHFLGARFSSGDRYIEDCAAGRGKTGNLSTWRQVGTSHHLEKVTHDIANFLAV